MPELTLSHWIYVITIAAVVFAMVRKRDVVLICMFGILVLGATYTGTFVGGLQTVFNALLTAGKELFDIMLVIALMVAMLRSLSAMGADAIMIAPAKKLMRTPTLAFFSIGLVMYVAALFFWPTPSTALVGTILIPVALEAGLPAMAAAMSVNILGHGMALSGDMVLQGAPGLTAGAAGVDTSLVMARGALFSIIAGVVAILVAFFMLRKELHTNTKASYDKNNQQYIHDEKGTPLARLFAVAVPLFLISMIVVMVIKKIKGGDATALLGGAGGIILMLSSLANHKDQALEKVAEYIREGFLFAIKIFAPVIPIAGFFFLGGGEAVQILGEGAPKLLFDIGTVVSDIIPLNKVALGFGNMFIGIITGLDGSGFSGLPLVGGLAAALGGPAGVDIPTLAAIGQMGAVWSGGGTITAWAFGLVATAGIAGVDPMELARKNFIPVIIGLTVATIVGIILM